MSQYWLMKTEPDTFSIDDLKKFKREPWDGVRNYQARNFMRDQMKKGDLILFYHSACKEPGIAGIAKVSKESHPDHTQFDKKSKYYDPKATKEEPRWFMVELQFVKKFEEPMSLKNIKEDQKLNGILVAKKGFRLSVMPVEEKHFTYIEKALS